MKHKFTRRSVLGGMCGALAAPLIIRASSAAAASNSVTIATWGGSYGETLAKQVFAPFTSETGIKVNVAPADFAKVKAQLMIGNVEWDIYDSFASEGAFGSKKGFWENLDASLFDSSDLAVPLEEQFASWYVNTAGIGWDPKRFEAGKHPANFAEFFDVNKFPGRRAIRAYAEGTLEAALLGDGVDPKAMYPLDVERALKVLGRIKPSVAAWSTSAQQPITLLQTGEVDFSFTTLNRVKTTNAPGGGAPLAFSLDQNTLYTECLAVLKGAPNKENAMKLIAYFLRPEVQARVLEPLGLMPVSKKAAQMASAEARKWLPDLNNPKNLMTNSAYWAEHNEAVSSRFKEWIQQG
ncbi:ABC transporter substrate-binding protein [Rhizobium esperanzae]|nr:ABC transporter substrate-binding protein [Rhizobium esperanzae]